MHEFCDTANGKLCPKGSSHILAQASVDSASESTLQELQQRFDRLSNQWYALTQKSSGNETMPPSFSFFNQYNVAVWLLEAGLAVVVVILFKVRQHLRLQPENAVQVRPKIETADELVEPESGADGGEKASIVKTSKFVRIKVRRVSAKKTK